MGEPAATAKCRGLRVALEIETQGEFIFQATTGTRRHKGLTGANSASGYHREGFGRVLLFSMGQPLEMCP